MQRQFDHNSDDFTLERIIEFGFDQFAEQINDISGAATKELAIEQVGFYYCSILKDFRRSMCKIGLVSVGWRETEGREICNDSVCATVLLTARWGEILRNRENHNKGWGREGGGL